MEINLKQLIALFVQTAAKYKEEPLGPFAAKMATLTRHVFHLTKRVVELDKIVADLVKLQQGTAQAPAPTAAVATPTAAPAPESAPPAAGEEDEPSVINDIARETAAELAAMSRPSAVTPLRKPAEAASATAKEAS